MVPGIKTAGCTLILKIVYSHSTFHQIHWGKYCKYLSHPPPTPSSITTETNGVDN